jgi:hypothetical protein
MVAVTERERARSVARLRAVELAAADLPGAEPWRGEVLRRGAALQAALRGGDEEKALTAAMALVGVGEGSTPAGDDYLVGVVHALRWLGARSPHPGADELPPYLGARDGRGAVPAAALLVALASLGQGRTTAASAAWLAASARGDASRPWAALLAALDGGEETVAVAAAAAAVRACGHTSGAFSLRGFVDVLAGFASGHY